ncbi:hypothetical protein [Azospirillum brasilense]|nr:hypothetical protein [Azospirillum brasilense]
MGQPRTPYRHRLLGRRLPVLLAAALVLTLRRWRSGWRTGAG